MTKSAQLPRHAKMPSNLRQEQTMNRSISTLPFAGDPRDALGSAIADAFFAEQLFDALPDVVFFVKDAQARYVVVNQTLVQRCGVKDKAALSAARLPRCSRSRSARVIWRRTWRCWPAPQRSKTSSNCISIRTAIPAGA